MGGDVVEREKKGGGKGGRRPKRRISIRIDMTPMVDIAFLLLIFYMVSTVFSMPQAMEINLPPEDEKEQVDIGECKILTIRVDGENRFFWNICNPADSMPRLVPDASLPGDTTGYKVDADSLRNILVNLNRNIPRLNTLLLIHKDARYEAMVDMLDEIDLLERSWNAAIAKENDLKPEDMNKDEHRDKRFSYRYAMGKWEPKDDRIVADALNAATGGGQ